MKAKTLSRHLREGVKNLSRNGWMTFASVSAVTVTLLLVGVFFNSDYEYEPFCDESRARRRNSCTH